MPSVARQRERPLQRLYSRGYDATLLDADYGTTAPTQAAEDCSRSAAALVIAG
jgi:hypothetical protein